MGALHEGHFSLVRKSKKENDLTICSIYVNPTQFNDKHDFSSYPRNEQQDIDYLILENCDILFLPKDHEIYVDTEDQIDHDVIEAMTVLEGEKRPGHFEGVVTIVNKLFNLISPDVAYFGEKDYQQLWIINLFTKKEKLNIEIKGCPTIRDQYGLALSSRNTKLSGLEIKHAPRIFQALLFCKRKIELIKSKDEAINTQRLQKIKAESVNNFIKNSLIKLDYFEVIDNENFRFASEIKIANSYRVLIAAHIGNIRLIDNILIE